FGFGRPCIPATDRGVITFRKNGVGPLPGLAVKFQWVASDAGSSLGRMCSAKCFEGFRPVLSKVRVVTAAEFCRGGTDVELGPPVPRLAVGFKHPEADRSIVQLRRELVIVLFDDAIDEHRSFLPQVGVA